MKSISLVTMIFLPGTFFAVRPIASIVPIAELNTFFQTLFSMTFFNWGGTENGHPFVSRYIWIYFLVTGVSTVITLGLWWFFLVHRQVKARGNSMKRWLVQRWDSWQ
jgi:hypothetical protein